MTQSEAIKTIEKLYKEWVGTKDYPGALKAYTKIKASIQSELIANRLHPKRCTDENKKETKGKAILLGKAWKAL